MKLLRTISGALQQTVTMILLMLAYGVGIGIVSILGKITGKAFLDRTPRKSSWTKPHKYHDAYTMF